MPAVYDLRTGPELAHGEVEELRRRLTHVELLVHRLLNEQRTAVPDYTPYTQDIARAWAHEDFA